MAGDRVRKAWIFSVSLIIAGLAVSLLFSYQDLLKTRRERDQALLERNQYKNQSEIWRRQGNELFENMVKWGRLDERLSELYGLRHYVEVEYDWNNITRVPWYLSLQHLVELMEKGEATVIINRTDWRVPAIRIVNMTDEMVDGLR